VYSVFNKILFFSIIVILISCTDPAKKEGIVIDGQFQNASGVKVIFRELDVDSVHNLDSVTLVENGLFRFRIIPSGAGFYILKSSSGEYILLLLEKEEEVNVFADLKKQPFDYKVTGSPGSILLKEFYDLTLPNLVKADSLRSALMENRDSPSFYQLSLSFDTLFLKLMVDQKNIGIKFIQQNSNSLASLIVLNYKFGMMPVLNAEEDFPVFLKLDSALSIRYPSNKHLTFHHKRVFEHQRQEREKQSINKSKL
jgi:hypothetical protein